MQQQALHPVPLVLGVLTDTPATDAGQRLRDQCRDKVESGFNFLLLPLSRPVPALNKQALTVADYENLPQAPFTRQAHKALTSVQWRSVVGVIDDLPASDMDAALPAFLLAEAVQWTRYLGLHGLMLPLHSGAVGERYAVSMGAALARVIAQTQHNGFDIWLRMGCNEQAWQIWNAVRHCVGVVPGRRLHVVLDLSAVARGDIYDPIHYRRWFGDTLAAILLPAAAFAADTRGEPVLAPHTAQVVAGFMGYPGIKWIIESETLPAQRYPDYRACLARLQNLAPPTWEESYLRSSVDQLQSPLQPLAEHLASISYEEFERDAVKYQQYEKAISQALAERHANASLVTLMVLGAGRGPIVDAAVRAARGFHGEVRLFVVEKNPSAVVTLTHRARDDWADMQVTIVRSDMRSWQTEVRADIIVSELLGSWGDNELSPECLDGAQSLLKPSGISIPAAYTSYLAPVASAKLHGTIASLIPFGHEELSTRAAFETMYVVRMGAVFQLAAEQACFTFTHPNPGAHSNERVASCVFEIPVQLAECTVHGFRGTFDCLLYGNHSISIADHNRSEGMFSWSPLFIPLISPFTVKGGTKLKVHLWRKVSPGKVWYEWCVEGHAPIHNPAGRASTIGAA